MDTKLCKHCQTTIPKKAKVCPQCRKKQGGKLKWIIVAVVALFIFAAAAGGGGGKEKTVATKTGETKPEEQKESGQTQVAATAEEVSNRFSAGDIVETEDLKITFISVEVYESDNQFIQPKDGYEYRKFTFKFENISKKDQTVSSMVNWECYADNSKADQTWIGDDNGLDATLSAGRETTGSIFFEVPVDASSVELEYDVNFWKSDKIVFIGK